MSTPNAQAGAISFAHLAGITTPVHAAKADAPDDKKDAKADDDSSDESMEDDEPKKDDEKKEDAKAESDEPDDDDKKDKAKKAKSEFQRGYAAATARFASVLGSRAYARNVELGASLLVNTTMNAAAIVNYMQNSPVAASSVDAARASRNPNLGVAAPAVVASTDNRWGAAFKRAGVLK